MMYLLWLLSVFIRLPLLALTHRDTYFIFGWRDFYDRLEIARFIAFNGDMRSGKTLLSHIVAHKLLADYRIKWICGNLPIRKDLASSPCARNSCAIVDEAGTVFDNRVAYKKEKLNILINDMTVFLGKSGSYMLFPTFATPDSRLRRGIRVERVRKMLFGYVWWYRWEHGDESLEGAERRRGFNWWNGDLLVWNPSAAFNTYDTYFPPRQLAPVGVYTERFLREYVENDSPKIAA